LQQKQKENIVDNFNKLKEVLEYYADKKNWKGSSENMFWIKYGYLPAQNILEELTKRK